MDLTVALTVISSRQGLAKVANLRRHPAVSLLVIRVTPERASGQLG